MVDIETLDSGPEAAVIVIGARMFTTSGPGKGFEVFIDNNKATRVGTVSEETLKWWKEQDPAVREQAFGGKVDPADAMYRFIEFVKRERAETIWANSPQFDCTILRHLAKQVSLRFPFHYRAERDCRTLFRLGEALTIDCDDLWRNPDRKAHNALDDATTQAQVAARIMGRIFNNPTAYSDPDSAPRLSAPGQLELLSPATDGVPVPLVGLQGSSR